MCGIAGAYSLKSEEILMREIERILHVQHARGPDYTGIEKVPVNHGTLIFGHNRLSIIDLSTAAHQPMWDREHRVCIVFNGEIYNYSEIREELIRSGHRFVTNSDTEVVLESYKRWGTDALPRFNGMFAFALFDTLDQRLLLVRDRFGVKPLYFFYDHSKFLFASTPGELAKILQLRPDPDYLASGLRFGLYDHDQISPFKCLNALNPGHFLTFTLRSTNDWLIEKVRYYNLEERVNALTDSMVSLNETKMLEQVSDLIANAVMIRLRSDVPVAVSLSGGLDSTSIAAIAARYLQNGLHGFTFGSPFERESEGPQVAEMGSMTPIKLHFAWPDGKAICDAYDKSLVAQAGPFPNGSIVAQYLVFEKAHDAGFKVLLGGQGGDEVFMGYRKFQWFHLRQLFDKREFMSAVSFLLSLVPTVFAEKHRWVDSWKNRQIYSNKSGRATIMNLPEVNLFVGHQSTEPLYRRQIMDVVLTSLPTLLRYEDSNSMGNSVESRLPFLDYRLLEYGIALPTIMKLRRGYGKWIVRQAMEGLIPESIRLARFKKGFDIQQNRWIDGGLGVHLRARLTGDLSCLKEWLKLPVNIESLFSDDSLKRNPMRFSEATTLLWLAAR